MRTCVLISWTNAVGKTTLRGALMDTWGGAAVLQYDVERVPIDTIRMEVFEAV